MALTGIDVTGRRLVIFDFDGTLADTIAGIVSTARTVMHARGWTDDALGEVRRLVGPPFPEAFSLVYGVSPEEAAEITREYRAIYRDLGLAGWPLFDGMGELLVRLKAHGKVLATATSKKVELLQRALDDNGVSDLFDFREGKAFDGGDEKHEIIARVIRRSGLTAGDAVMVGDRNYDIEGAAKNGVPCIGVTFGHTCPEQELVDAGACAVAHTPQELERLLLG